MAPRKRRAQFAIRRGDCARYAMQSNIIMAEPAYDLRRPTEEPSNRDEIISRAIKTYYSDAK